MYSTWTGRAALTAALALSLMASAEDKPLPRREMPANDRAALVIPDDVWERALSGSRFARRTLGYSGDEMRNYGGREGLLRSVENLFRDARLIPRTTGRITDEMLASAKAGNPGELSMACWGLTDIPAGRMYTAPVGDEWGLAEVPKGTTPADAYAILLGLEDRPPSASRRATLITQFGRFPAALQRFLVRLAVARRIALPWLQQSIVPLAEDADGSGMRASLMAPWADESNDQSATLDGRCFQWLKQVDRAPVAYGSAIFLFHMKQALADIRTWLDGGGRAEVAKLGEREWRGMPGICVLGTESDVTSGSQRSIVVDLGGNDRWKGRLAVSNGPENPLSVVIDLDGDDDYEAGDDAFAMGCGVFGLGAIFDLSGDDRYTVKESGLGCGWFGTGLVWDGGGDDVYTVRDKWGQGAAHAGAGMLVDLSGNDRYECAQQSQGLGSTLGCGLLLDAEGNDTYWCRDDGNVSALYLNQSVAMAQGCGYGRRADIGDGRSLAGGWGLLVDGAGNDRYHAQCWSQGCGYWWGIGALEDRGGNDIYENGKYSLGAGAHYAVGVQVDLAGDDRYNLAVMTTKNQFQGHARDGSIGISIDGDGDDHYHLKNMCGGCADLASIAIFWDRRGDDEYEAVIAPDMGDAGPFGSATTYPPSRTFRDDLPAVGVFLDTGGRDTYKGDPRGGAGAHDGGEWAEHRGPASFGFGLDAPVYK